MLDRTLPAAPRAERRPVTSTRHGITLTDDYAWLRADNWRELMPRSRTANRCRRRCSPR